MIVLQSDLIAAYAKAHYDYNAISPDRRRQQPKILAAFADHVAPLELTAVGGRELRDYLATRLADGLAPTTIGKDLAMIRPFYAWLYQERRITADQLLDIREVKPPRGASYGEPRPYNEKEIPRFWRDLERAYPWAKGGGPRGNGEMYLQRWLRGTSPWKRVAPYAYRLQVEAVTALAIYGGLRQDEIYRLDLELMHYDNAYVLAGGARKNRDGLYVPRAVPWTVPDMNRAVREWLEFRELLDERVGIPHDRPWLTLRPVQHATNRMPKRTFALLICSVGRGWQYHRMRHTAATEMLRAGYELETVQEIMGHASIEMTRRYARLLTEDVLRTARRSEKNLAGRMERLRAAGGSA